MQKNPTLDIIFKGGFLNLWELCRSGAKRRKRKIWKFFHFPKIFPFFPFFAFFAFFSFNLSLLQFSTKRFGLRRMCRRVTSRSTFFFLGRIFIYLYLIIFFLRIDYWADRIEFKIRVIFPLVDDWFQKNPGPNFWFYVFWVEFIFIRS